MGYEKHCNIVYTLTNHTLVYTLTFKGKIHILKRKKLIILIYKAYIPNTLKINNEE